MRGEERPQRLPLWQKRKAAIAVVFLAVRSRHQHLMASVYRKTVPANARRPRLLKAGAARCESARKRAIVYKAVVLTGLRRGELASLTVRRTAKSGE